MILQLALTLVSAHLPLNAETERVIAFTGQGGLKMEGTLAFPENAKEAPCLLLMPGSGPTDRDGNQPTIKTDVLKQIADRLKSDGIATFRFDKRPVARYQSQWPKTVETINEFFSVENHLADAEAAFKTMVSQPECTPKLTGLLGHSEGGSFALELASKLQVNTVVLCGTIGRNMKDVIHDQIAQSLDTSKVTPEIKKQYLDNLDALMDEIRRDGKPTTKPLQGLGALFNPTTYKIMEGYQNMDSIARAKQFGGSVLVLNGEKDVQVSATKDAALIFAALSVRKGGKQEIAIIPGASHNLKKLTDGDPMSSFTGPIVPEALSKIAEWCKTNLKK